MVRASRSLFGMSVSGMAALVLLSCLPIRSGIAEEIPYAHNLPPGQHPVEVRARFYLSDINEIDERTETFEIKGLINLQWQDERQAFDPEMAGAAEKHYQGTYQFLEIYNGWWPQLVLANGAGGVALQGVALRIAPDGTMSFVQEISAVVESPMNLRRYPFDRQRLKAIFEPLAFYADEVRLVTAPNMTDLPDRPVRIAGWELLELSAETRIDHDEASGKRFSLFVVTLEMSRRPAFTLWYVMVPLSLIVLISMVVFSMDRDSFGNRMDISFIGLLTIVAFQALVEARLPQIEYLTLLSGFLYIAYLTMAASVLANLWVDKLNRRGAEARADRFDSYARWLFPAAYLVLNLLSAAYFLLVPN